VTKIDLLKLAKNIVERKGGDVSSIIKLLQKNISVVILMVNSECNIKCKHCYLPYNNSRSPENTLATVNDLQANGYNVTIAGSETLLELDYLKSYQKAKQKHLLTNGILLDKDSSIYDRLREHGIEQLTFSLHFGIDSQIQSVPEKLVSRVIKETKSRGFKVQITTTITSQTYTKIKEMCEKAKTYGADKLYFGRFVNMGRAKSCEHLKLTDAQVSEFFENLTKIRKQYGKDELEIRAHGYFGPRPGSIGAELAKVNCYCPAGIKSVVVDPNNDVYGCPFTMGEDLKIGRFENGKIEIDPEALEKNLLCGKRNTCIAHLVH
jgi:MoaA/NifB/PqqE/SkfB family radical SAM enzyme